MLGVTRVPEGGYMDKGKAVVTLLAGSAVVMGAGLLVSKVHRTKTPRRRAVRPEKPETQEPTPYPCTVPEGADICYPQ
jgi:hypothetical protein